MESAAGKEMAAELEIDLYGDIQYDMMLQLSFSPLQGVLRAIIERLKSLEGQGPMTNSGGIDLSELMRSNEEMKKQLALLAIQIEQQTGRGFLSDDELFNQGAVKEWPAETVQEAKKINANQKDAQSSLRLLASWLQSRRDGALPTVPKMGKNARDIPETREQIEEEAQLLPERKANLAQQLDLLAGILDDEVAAGKGGPRVKPSEAAPGTLVPVLQKQGSMTQKHLNLVVLRLNHPSSVDQNMTAVSLPELPGTTGMPGTKPSKGHESPENVIADIDVKSDAAKIAELEKKVLKLCEDEGIQPFTRPSTAGDLQVDPKAPIGQQVTKAAAAMDGLVNKMDWLRSLLWALHWKRITPKAQAGDGGPGGQGGSGGPGSRLGSRLGSRMSSRGGVRLVDYLGMDPTLVGDATNNDANKDEASRRLMLQQNELDRQLGNIQILIGSRKPLEAGPPGLDATTGGGPSKWDMLKARGIGGSSEFPDSPLEALVQEHAELRDAVQILTAKLEGGGQNVLGSIRELQAAVAKLQLQAKAAGMPRVDTPPEFKDRSDFSSLAPPASDASGTNGVNAAGASGTNSENPAGASGTNGENPAGASGMNGENPAGAANETAMGMNASQPNTGSAVDGQDGHDVGSNGANLGPLTDIDDVHRQLHLHDNALVDLDDKVNQLLGLVDPDKKLAASNSPRFRGTDGIGTFAEANNADQDENGGKDGEGKSKSAELGSVGKENAGKNARKDNNAKHSGVDESLEDRIDELEDALKEKTDELSKRLDELEALKGSQDATGVNGGAGVGSDSAKGKKPRGKSAGKNRSTANSGDVDDADTKQKNGGSRKISMVDDYGVPQGASLSDHDRELLGQLKALQDGLSNEDKENLKKMQDLKGGAGGVGMSPEDKALLQHLSEKEAEHTRKLDNLDKQIGALAAKSNFDLRSVSPAATPKTYIFCRWGKGEGQPGLVDSTDGKLYDCTALAKGDHLPAAQVDKVTGSKADHSALPEVNEETPVYVFQGRGGPKGFSFHLPKDARDAANEHVFVPGQGVVKPGEHGGGDGGDGADDGEEPENPHFPEPKKAKSPQPPKGQKGGGNGQAPRAHSGKDGAGRTPGATPSPTGAEDGKTTPDGKTSPFDPNAVPTRGDVQALLDPVWAAVNKLKAQQKDLSNGLGSILKKGPGKGAAGKGSPKGQGTSKKDKEDEANGAPEAGVESSDVDTSGAPGTRGTEGSGGWELAPNLSEDLDALKGQVDALRQAQVEALGCINSGQAQALQLANLLAQVATASGSVAAAKLPSLEGLADDAASVLNALQDVKAAMGEDAAQKQALQEQIQALQAKLGGRAGAGTGTGAGAGVAGAGAGVAGAGAGGAGAGAGGGAGGEGAGAGVAGAGAGGAGAGAGGGAGGEGAGQAGAGAADAAAYVGVPSDATVAAEVDALKSAIAKQASSMAARNKMMDQLLGPLQEHMAALVGANNEHAGRAASLLGVEYEALPVPDFKSGHGGATTGLPTHILSTGAKPVHSAGSLSVYPPADGAGRAVSAGGNRGAAGEHAHGGSTGGDGPGFGFGTGGTGNSLLEAKMREVDDELAALRQALKDKADGKDTATMLDKLEQWLLKKADRADLRALMDRRPQAVQVPVATVGGARGDAGADGSAGSAGADGKAVDGADGGSLPVPALSGGSSRSGTAGSQSRPAAIPVAGLDSGSASQEELVKALNNHAKQIQQLFLNKADVTNLDGSFLSLKEMMEALDQRKLDTDVGMRKAEHTYVDLAIGGLRREMINTLNTASSGIVDTLDKSLNVLRGMLDTKADQVEFHQMKQLMMDRGMDEPTADGLAGFRCLSCNKTMDMRTRPAPSTWGQFQPTQRPKQAPMVSWKQSSPATGKTVQSLMLTQSSHHSGPDSSPRKLPPLPPAEASPPGSAP